MSKKMIKRSLALGALMAFVITGSAWAEEVEGINGSYSGDGTETLIYNDGTGISGWQQDVKVENVAGMVFKDSGIDPNDLTLSTTEGKITLLNVGRINTNNEWSERWFFNALGGTIDVDADSVDVYTTKYGVLAQNTSDTNIGNISITTSGDINITTGWENIYVTSQQGYHSASSINLDADNIILSTYNWKEEYGDSYWYSAAVWVGSKDGSEAGNSATLIADEDIIISGGKAIHVKKGTSVNNALVNLNAGDDVALYGEEYGILAESYAKADVNAKNIYVEAINKNGNAYSIYAEKSSQVDLVGTTINITADSANGEARAVNARGENATYDAIKGSVINLGNADTENINITVNGDGYGLISQYQGSAINVLGDELTITGSGDVTGIIAQNQTVTETGKVNTDTDYADNAKVVIGEGTVTKIDVANGIGISAMSMGQVNVAGDLYVNAKTAVEARGDSIIEINKSGNKTVQLDGDILFDYADNSRTTINAAVDINLANDKSYFKGSIIADPSTKQGEVAGMKLALSNGATWELSKASIVNQVSFGKDTTFILKDGSVFEKQADASNDVYALNAAEGISNQLTVEQGAKLQIGGIKETTYNIATGFESYSDVAGWTEIADNALLQAEKVINTTDKTLQVAIKAKSTEDMASDTGISESTAGLVQSIIEGAGNADKTPEQEAAVEFIENVIANNNNDSAAVGNAINAATKMAEAGGNNATAANIVKNVTGITNDRLSFNCGHSAPHKGGHGVGLLEEGSGADIWVEYVHGKDKVEDMPSTAGATSYEGQFNGIVMGVDFKKVNKFQSGVAFNYGEGDTNSVGSVARTHSDYDFWGIGYYGNIHNDDSNVLFDINFAKTDSDVTQNNSGTTFEASPETTTWSAGVKLEKLYQNENVQIVPYTGLRYMSIDSDDYSTKCGAFSYSMDRQDIWLLPLGVSIKQEVVNDNGWTVSPRVDLSYIWAFGDTNSNMEVKSPFAGVSQLGYDVMDDGSFLGLVGIEAHKGQWGYGVSYSYQKGDHSESKKWYVDVNYSF